MKKYLCFAFLLSCFLCFAEEDVAMYRVTIKPKEKKEEKKEEDQIHPLDQGCPSNVGMFVKADYLCWKTKNLLSIYAGHAVLEKTTEDNVSIYTNHNRSKHVKSDWHSGVRATLGYNLENDNWDVLSNFTYFYAKNKASDKVSDYTLIAYGPSKNGFNTAQGDFQLHYYMAVAELGKSFYAKQKLAIRPSLGLEGGSILQKTTVLFTEQNPQILTQNQNLITVYDSLYKDHFWGIGPRAAVRGDFHLTNNFSFFGNIAFSLLLGNADVLNDIYINEISQDGSNNISYLHLKDKTYDMKPHSQFILGFCYGTCFNNEKMFFGIDVAGEFNYFWTCTSGSFVFEGMLDMLFLPTHMEGVTVGARLEF